MYGLNLSVHLSYVMANWTLPVNIIFRWSQIKINLELPNHLTGVLSRDGDFKLMKTCTTGNFLRLLVIATMEPRSEHKHCEYRISASQSDYKPMGLLHYTLQPMAMALRKIVKVLTVCTNITISWLTPEIKSNNPNNTNMEIRRQKMSIQNIPPHRCHTKNNCIVW